jgi:hypothetical protein
VSVSKDSVPYKFRLGADSKLRDRGGLHALYSYDSVIPRADYVKKITTHKFIASGDYKFGARLFFNASLENRTETREDQNTDYKRTDLKTSLKWQASYRTNVRGEMTYSKVEIDQSTSVMQLSLHYNYKLSHVTDVKCRWFYQTYDNESTRQEFSLSASSAVRKTRLSAEFNRRDDNGLVDNSILLSLTRDFGRRQ